MPAFQPIGGHPPFRLCDPPPDVERYVQRIQADWDPLRPVEQRHVIENLNRFYNPAAAVIQAIANPAGWRWAWNGEHRSDAVAMLLPITGVRL
jgi:hypothetical protein